jgi:hypothetical protein
MTGIVYVLTNESMANVVKIGLTTGGVEERIKQLDTTSVPLPFQCFYAAEVADAALVESKLHKIFADKRVRSNREFFRVAPDQVREAIQLAELKDVTPKTDVVLEASDTQAIKNAVANDERRSRLRFSTLGIAVGEELTFAKDENEKCTVVSDGKVQYNDQVMSPSAAALLVVRKLGYNWSAVSGSDYWQYKDETLTAMRLRLEDEGAD